MNTSRHPALSTGGDDVPALTLVLPPGLGGDQLLAGLAEAIGQARAPMAARAQLFHHRAGQYAADGDQLGHALYRGQARGSEDAVGTIDETIIEVFGLWEQYWPQLSPAEIPTHDPPPAAPPAACITWPHRSRARRHDRPCR